MKKNLKTQIHDYENLKDTQGNNFISIKKIENLGFPSKPSCMAYSRHLGLLAIASENGTISVIGIPGYQINGDFSETQRKIVFLQFICFKKKILTISKNENDYFVDFWNICDSESVLRWIEEDSICIYDIYGKISAVCLSQDFETLALGVKQSNVYLQKLSPKNTNNFILTEEYLFQNCGMKKYFPRVGSVQSLQMSNSKTPKLLIGYSSGIILIWDVEELKIISSVYKKECLLSVCWGSNETMFVSSHVKGIICCWSPTNISNNKDIFSKYSPVSFCPRDKKPCQGIDKIIWRDYFFIYTGGLPEEIPFERHIISIMTGGIITQIVEFGSKIIQFVDVSVNAQLCPESIKNSFFLFVLTAEELVTLLIQPMYEDNKITKNYEVKEIVPYHFMPFNSSNINSNLFCEIKSEIFFENLHETGKKNSLSLFEEKWPLDGGIRYLKENLKINHLIITGHEDGNLYFWNICDKRNSSILYIIETSKFYHHQMSFDFNTDERFCAIAGIKPKKYGFYDQYCDDPRYAIQKIVFCPETHTLILGGSAGNVLLMRFNSGFLNVKAKYIECNLMLKYPNFIWKGNEKLELNPKIAFKSGYYLDALINIFPFSPISSLEYCLKWGLIGVGTLYGFLLFDSHNYTVIYSFCTYDVSALPFSGENIQRNSFLRSLRNSLRIFSSKKKKAFTLQNLAPDSDNRVDLDSGDSVHRKSLIREATFGRESFRRSSRGKNSNGSRDSQRFESMMKTSSTRFVGGKKIDPTLKGLIRSMAFVECPMQNTPKIKQMFIAGSNYGKLYIHFLNVKFIDRHTYLKSVESIKEIQMNRKSSIINLKMIGMENFGVSLSSFGEVSDKITPFDNYLLCCSEEQIKVINLFNFKTKLKLNLTSTQGIRLRKLFCLTRDKIRGKLSHYYMGITNYGRLMIIGTNNLKCLETFDFLQKDNIQSLNTLNATSEGFIMFQNSSTEIKIFCVKSQETNDSKPIVKTRRRSSAHEKE